MLSRVALIRINCNGGSDCRIQGRLGCNVLRFFSVLLKPSSYRMLQVKIGQVVYPDYDISVTRSLFASSQDFER